MEFHHISVLLNECIDNLNIKPDGIYVDGTMGGGGHSLEIAKRLTTGRLICIDQDPNAREAAESVWRNIRTGLPLSEIILGILKVFWTAWG